MSRKKNKTPLPVNPNWVITTHWTGPTGRLCVPGAEISIKGERGRFKFVRHVLNKKSGAEWIDVIGKDRTRSFRPDRLKTVHRLLKLRQSA